MKKTLILITMIFILSSCWEWTKEAWTISSEYIDTLQDSVVDAKDVKIMMEAGQWDLQKQIDAAKK